MEQVHHFQKGKLYLIVSKKYQKAMRLEQSALDSRIIGDDIDPNKLNQLWFIEQVQTNDYQITNAITGYCFEEEGGQIRLEKGKKASDQLFYMQKACKQGYLTYYWIKTSKKSKRSLIFNNDILRYGAFDPNDTSQMFRLDHVPTNDILKRVSVIENNKSDKVIDLHKLSIKQGSKIVQSHKNRHFNQRWELIKKAPMIYAMRNMMSGMAITIEQEDHREPQNAKIIQSFYKGHPSQLWKIQRKQHGLFIIWSMLFPLLMIGVQDDGVKNGDELRLVYHQTKWRFEGYVPLD